MQIRETFMDKQPAIFGALTPGAIVGKAWLSSNRDFFTNCYYFILVKLP